MIEAGTRVRIRNGSRQGVVVSVNRGMDTSFPLHVWWDAGHSGVHRDSDVVEVPE